MQDDTNKPEDKKSGSDSKISMSKTDGFASGLLVINATTTCSYFPMGSVRQMHGLSFDFEKSSNGKGTKRILFFILFEWFAI